MSTTGGNEIERFGLIEVYSCDQPNADIVLVHGLNGHPRRTWTSQKTGIFWPKDLLPADFELDRKARVLVYGYDADVTSTGKGASKDKIHNHAELLVAYLVANRRRQHAEQRPIIFVAHSLGGLVVKRALIHSSGIEVGSSIERLRSVYLSTHGIIFMGTPHHGSDLAVWGSYLEKLASAILPKKLLDTSDQLVDALKSDSETLVNIDRGFMNLIGRFHIYYFHEAKPTDVKGTLRFVVDEESAAPTLPNVERAGIQSDHSHMCKFDSASSPGYVLVSEAITTYIDEEIKGQSVGQNWVMERRQRMIMHGSIMGFSPSSQPEVSEPPSRRGSSSQMESRQPSFFVHEESVPKKSTLISHKQDNMELPFFPVEPKQISIRLLENHTPEPYLFVPPGFRENLVFVGMRKQLEEVDARLFDRQRRQTGTASVLLYGSPGAGKSHLARQYIYENRKKFQGGIFWIRARHLDEMHKDLLDIAQKIIAENSPGIRIEPSGKGKDLESTIWEWFSSRDEWLIVLDGVVVDRKQDIELLQKSIPSKAHSSLIYTSRSSQFQLSHRLMNPRPIRVPPLNDEEGQDLIFREVVGARRTSGNRRAARDIVHQVGGLPLALHVISVRLVMTREPLEAYRIKSWMDDDKLGGLFRAILKDLSEQNPGAYNLINILSFFGPHIPVELIRLGTRGIRASGLTIKASIGSGSTPEINGSLSILMQNALVERNEDDIDSSTPTDSSKSTLVGLEPMDVLRLHTVVQKFCRDRLDRGADQFLSLPQWIDLASKLLKWSYHEACQIMADRQKDHPPRVTDYHEYLLHAKEMREHSITYEHKSQPLIRVQSALDDLIANIESKIENLEPTSSQSSFYVAKSVPSVFDRISTASSSSFTSEEGSSPAPKIKGFHYLDDDTGRITEADAPFRFSPTDHRAPPQYEANALTGTAIEMLRSISDRTIRPLSAVSDEIESAIEPKHVRTSSLPTIQGPSGIYPPAARPKTAIDAKSAEARFAPRAASQGNTTVVYSHVIPYLTTAHNRQFVPSRMNQKNALYGPSLPLATEATVQDRLPLQRVSSTGALAPPLLTTQEIPNPLAVPFYPREYPVISTASSAPEQRSRIVHSARSTSQNGPSANLQSYNIDSIWANQQQTPAPSYPTYVIRQPQDYLPQITSSFVPVAGTQTYQLLPLPVFPPVLDATQLLTGQNQRHERAASAPNVGGPSSHYGLVDPLRRASDLSSVHGWSHPYTDSAPQRFIQSQIWSPAGQGFPVRPEIIQTDLDALQISSAPQFRSPFSPPPPPQVDPQIVAGAFPPSSPLAFQALRSSPLQAVENARDFPSPRSLSPAKTVQSRAQLQYPPAPVPPQTTVSQFDEYAKSLNPGEIQDFETEIRMTNNMEPSSPQVIQNMSRSISNPGPGIIAPGLGITEFGDSSRIASQTDPMVFGQHSQVNIPDTRNRSLDYEVNTQPQRSGTIANGKHSSSNIVIDRAGWGAHSEIINPGISAWDSPSIKALDPLPKIQGPTPYPDINQMPADTDAERLQTMLGELSAKQSPSPPQYPIHTRRATSRARAQSEPHADMIFQFQL